LGLRVKKKEPEKGITAFSGLFFHQNTGYILLCRSSGLRIVWEIAAFPPRWALKVAGFTPAQNPIPDYSGGTATESHRVPRCKKGI